MTENALEVIQLSCVRQSKPLFSAISFQLAAGKAIVIEGPNGVGKSSLLRITSGLATPFTGEIRWRGNAIQHHTPYRENLHYLGHLNGIKLGLTVRENLQLAHKLHANQTQLSFHTILSSLQLTDYENTLAAHLSAGQKRRLALARIFLFPKPVWMLDEPLTALDSSSQLFFLSQLTMHLQTGGIALISSHHAIQVEKAMITSLRLAPC